MTTNPGENQTGSRDRVTNGWVEIAGYEWTCPICGQSRMNNQSGPDGEENAIAALRTHIVASDGSEHGPRNESPPALDTLSLEEYVVEVSGKR